MFIGNWLTKDKDGGVDREKWEERPIRSVAKAISWRVTGTLDTIFLAWLFTDDISIALAIGLTEVLTKFVLYYFHERAWLRISWGR